MARLVAGPLLVQKLESEPVASPNRTLVETVIGWYRTGLQQPLPEADARRLWAETSLSHYARSSRQSLEEQDLRFRKASEWAREAVSGREWYEQALLTRESGA